MHDRFFERVEENTYVVANKGRDVEPDSNLLPNGQIYDEKGRRLDVEGNSLTLEHGQPFPD